MSGTAVIVFNVLALAVNLAFASWGGGHAMLYAAGAAVNAACAGFVAGQEYQRAREG